MSLRVVRSAPCLGLLALMVGMSGCIRYERYVRAPHDPRREAAAYTARRLDDPALARFLVDHGATPLDTGLTPTALALAALYFRSDLGAARASVSVARAAEITAGTRPQPSAGGTIERASQGSDGSPWTVSLTAGLIFETGGKRSARIGRKRAVTIASELRLHASAWQIAQEARHAAVASVGAERDLADIEAESAQLRAVLDLLRARYAEGRISLADIAQAETDVQLSVVALAQGRRTRTDARAALARALGIPLGRVISLAIRAEPGSACNTVRLGIRSESADTLRAMALRGRYDVGAVLADYAVAESDLRLELARQHPDISIGPGIAWDQSAIRWILGFGTPAIPVARNRGPIAEARARRAVQAARLAFVEDTVLAQVDSAVAACRDFIAEVGAADSLIAVTAERLRLTEAAFGRGEVGQTEVALARLARVRVARTRRQAVQRGQAAGAALEAALGRFISVPGVRWPDVLELPEPGAAPAGGQRKSRE